MNRNELIAAMAVEAGISVADAARALEVILAEITEALVRGESVSLPGFGTFKVKTRATRTGRNPHTGQIMQIAGARVPAFTASKALKDAQPGSRVHPPKTEEKQEGGEDATRGIPEEAPTDGVARPEPAGDQRRVNAQIRHDGKKRKTFVCGAENVIRCWIGIPDPENAASSDENIPTLQIPDEGLQLTVQMRWRGEAGSRLIILPADPTARTGDCDFRIRVPDNERYVSAEIIFRYRGSVFEFVRLEAFAIAPGEEEKAHHDVLLRSDLDARQVIEVEDRQQVDAAILWGEDRSHAAGPDDTGTTTLRVFGSGNPKHFDLSDADKAIKWLNNELFVTEKSLVRKRPDARVEAGGVQLDGNDEDVMRILHAMAEHGTELFNQLLLQGFRDPGERIQLINTEPSEYVPIEFVYDRGYPVENATLCEPGLEALNSDAADCPECKPAHALSLEERDGAAKICPFGFWSLRKIIERRDPKSLPDDAHGQPSVTAAQRRSLPAIDSVLFASSARVPEDERAKTVEALSSHFPSPTIARDWTQWKSLLKDNKPPLLVVLPHHHIESNQDFLEIGARNLPKRDRLLSRGRLTDLFVNPGASDPGPIVILFGCRTAAESETGYVHLARRFQHLSTAMVVGTLAKVLGRHAAPVARELVSELVSIDEPNVDFGTIMRRLRRRMLAKGYLMALCLVALGDAEWRLAPREPG